jgi:hypothetical protein
MYSVKLKESLSTPVLIDAPHILGVFSRFELAELLIRIFFVVVQIRFIETVSIVATKVTITIKIIKDLINVVCISTHTISILLVYYLEYTIIVLFATIIVTD